MLSILDLKLGVRMLLRYPGLSLVSVIGMAVAIAIGAGYFGALGALLDSALPVPDGDRVVAVRYLNLAQAGKESRASPRDFAAWREELRSVLDLNAFRESSQNLIRA